MLNVRWGNRLEDLAAALFASMDAESVSSPAEVLGQRQCVIVPNRIVQHWLQHEFVFRETPRQVLANCDFPLANVFVNERLFRLMDSDGAQRDPAAHPFSREALTWRICHVLGSPLLDDARFLPLREYVQPASGHDATETLLARRRFKLATRLAALFDEYAVYRPDMLVRWEAGKIDDLPSDLAWQPALWQVLTANGLADRTYLAAFRRMQTHDLAACGVTADYRRVRVFGVALLPRVYIHFFERLSQTLPVDFFVLNPSDAAWFDAPCGTRRESALQGRLDSQVELFDPGNTFLGAQGRGNREFLVELLDRTEGQAEADGTFAAPGDDSLLHALQSSLLANDADAHTSPDAEQDRPAALRSVQVHVCHGPMREVEVLRDHLLRWFTEEPDLQPRQVQVQVSDMATYAPYIHAVFTSRERHASSTIPYAIADRVAASESGLALAFLQLLTLADSRFTASEVLDLLQCDALRDAFAIPEDQVGPLRNWVAQAGVRWGRTREHREQMVGVDFDDYATWRRGLDRLLLGYAYGSPDGLPSDSLPLPCDATEGESAVTLGRLARFVAQLEALANACTAPRPLADWAVLLDGTVATFFANTNDTYHDLTLVRSAIARLRTSAAAADFTDPVPVQVVRDALAASLQDVLGGDDLGANVVTFSALRPGSSVPRRIVCLLGMADGLFPRCDNRPAYDLLRCERRYGDRSLRQEDRMAFLEAVTSARDRLYVSYTGFTAEENQEVPPSVVVAELRDALDRVAGCGSSAQNATAVCRPVRHRLQSCHPDYFGTAVGNVDSAPLFSYASDACETAKALVHARRNLIPGVPPYASSEQADAAAAPTVGDIDVEELIRFFRNPAEAYYRDVLGARLDVKADAELAEHESFNPQGLESYTIETAIAEALASDADPAHARRLLLERGLVPLGASGAAWFDDQWQELAAFLDQEERAVYGRLIDALKRQRAAVPARCVAPVPCGARVSGLIAAVPTDTGTRALDLRYVSDRPKDKLACWLRHLLACAAGQTESRVYVREDKRKAVTRVFGPVAAAEARAALNEYVLLYAEGQTGILPFTPTVSEAYAKEWHTANDRDDLASREAAAMKSARVEWEKSRGYGGYRLERDDPYYWTAFGAAGPYADQTRFAAIACMVFSAVLFRAAKATSDAKGGPDHV